MLVFFRRDRTSLYILKHAYLGDVASEASKSRQAKVAIHANRRDVPPVLQYILYKKAKPAFASCDREIAQAKLIYLILCYILPGIV